MSRLKKSHSFEQLETRLTMAGNVTASVVSGKLTLIGDATDNNIYVTKGALAGEYRIVGNEDSTTHTATTINGLNEVVVSGVTDSIEASLSGGNDEILVQSITIHDLTIFGGAGNDTIRINEHTSVQATNPSTNRVTIDGTLYINSDLGDDIISIDRLYGGTERANITSRDSGGTTNLSTYVVFANNIDFRTGSQDDNFSIGFTTAHGAYLEVGAGDDLISFYTSHIEAQLTAIGGIGDDFLAFDVNKFDSETVIGDYYGENSVLFSRSVCATVVQILLGSGNDSLLVGKYYAYVNNQLTLQNAGSTIDLLQIETGGGNDSGEIAANVVESMYLLLGLGDDDISLESNLIQTRISIYGDGSSIYPTPGGPVTNPANGGYDKVRRHNNSFDVPGHSESYFAQGVEEFIYF